MTVKDAHKKVEDAAVRKIEEAAELVKEIKDEYETRRDKMFEHSGNGTLTYKKLDKTVDAFATLIGTAEKRIIDIRAFSSLATFGME